MPLSTPSYSCHLMEKNPHSIVIMDNASIRHVDGIMDLITGVGALLIFLPPYSPDYNIEEAFSKAKTLIKAYKEEMESISLWTC